MQHCRCQPPSNRGESLIETLLALPILALWLVGALEVLAWLEFRNATRYAAFVAARSAAVHWRASGSFTEAKQTGSQATQTALTDALDQSRTIDTASGASRFLLRADPGALAKASPIIEVQVKRQFDHPCRQTQNLVTVFGFAKTFVCPRSWQVESRLPFVLQGYSPHD